MSTVAYLFSEVTETAYLGNSRVRWRELVRVHDQDDESSRLRHEYDAVYDYFDPESQMVITKAASSGENDKAIITFDGGFNVGDSFNLTINLDGVDTLITATLEYIAVPSYAAQIVGEAVTADPIEVFTHVVWGEDGEDGILEVWPQNPGSKVSLADATVQRAAIELPQQVEDFIAAVKTLG